MNPNKSEFIEEYPGLENMRIGKEQESDKEFMQGYLNMIGGREYLQMLKEREKDESIESK